MKSDLRVVVVTTFLTISAVAVGQTKVPPAAAARIAGTVVDGQTNKPVPGVSVSMLQGNERKNVATDASGQFTFAATHGTVRLITSKTGYASLRPVGHNLPTDGLLISLTPGQQMHGLNLLIWPSGSITGTVYDSKSKPVQYARTFLMRYTYDENGRRVLKAAGPTAGGETNDHGQFQIADVDPGDYYLEIDPPLFSERVPGEPFTPSKPAPVSIKPGAETHSGDLTLPSVRGATMHLRLVNQTGQAIQNTMTKYLHWNRRNDSGTSTMVPLLIMGGPERAEIPVPIGIYSVTAGWMNGSTTNAPALGLGNAIVEAGPTTADTPIVVKKGVKVGGQALLEQAKGTARPLGSVRCDFTSDAFPAISATGAADGSVSVDNAQPTAYDVECSSSLPDAYIDTIKQGERDVVKQGLQIMDSGETPTFTISFAQSSATIEGKIAAANGKAAGALVALVPDAADAKNLYRKTYADQNGAFTIRTVAPGAYHVFSWTELDGAEYKNAEFMSHYEGQGTAVKIGVNEKKVGVETKLLEQ